MNNFTVAEIQEKKKELERAITESIKKFNHETNTIIYDIDIKYCDFHTNYGYSFTALKGAKLKIDYERFPPNKNE